MGIHRRDDHEDDQQHEQYINQRCDIHLGGRAAARSQIETHYFSPAKFDTTQDAGVPEEVPRQPGEGSERELRENSSSNKGSEIRARLPHSPLASREAGK